MWAEVWRSGAPARQAERLSPEVETEVRRQRQFMQEEDVDSGLILAFMRDSSGLMGLLQTAFPRGPSQQFAQPQRWQTKQRSTDIMNQLIREVLLPGWRYFDKPRRCTGTDYGSQKGWEGASTNDDTIETAR